MHKSRRQHVAVYTGKDFVCRRWPGVGKLVSRCAALCYLLGYMHKKTILAMKCLIVVVSVLDQQAIWTNLRRQCALVSLFRCPSSSNSFLVPWILYFVDSPIKNDEVSACGCFICGLAWDDLVFVSCDKTVASWAKPMSHVKSAPPRSTSCGRVPRR